MEDDEIFRKCVKQALTIVIAGFVVLVILESWRF